MLEYERIDVSERIDLTKSDQKNVIFVIIGIF